MKRKRQALLLILALLGLTQNIYSEPTATERSQFEAVRTRAKHGDAQAQLDLGSLYASGNGVARDLRAAVKWHRKAAEQGLARAQYVLAGDYAEGQGTRRDPVEAFGWYRRAADQGLAEAQLAVGNCYARGDGVEEDVVAAIKHYRAAAEQGLAAGIGQLGECYLEGTGVAVDTAEGVKWVCQAAGLGYAPAQNRLGLCYFNGRGVPKDLVQAYKWFNLAAAQGGDLALDAKVNLAKVASGLTPDQITQAQESAREFKPGAQADPLAAAHTALGGLAGGDPGLVSKSHDGLLSVSGQDPGYEIYVDSAFVGNPVAKVHLPPGSHLVEVKKAGCRDYRKEIQVTEQSDLSLHVALEPQ